MASSRRRPPSLGETANRLPVVLVVLAVAALIAADLLLNWPLTWIDYLAVGIIAFFAVRGYRKGLVDSLFGLAGYLAGAIAAVVFSPRAAVFLMNHTAFGESFSKKIESIAPGLFSIGIGDFDAASSSADLVLKNPSIQEKLQENPLIRQLYLAGDPAGRASEALSGSVSTLGDLIVFSMFRMLAFMLLFAGVKLLVVLIGRLITLMLGRSLLGAANRTGGMGVGLAIGLILAYATVVYVLPFLGSVRIIRLPEAYEDSLTLKWFSMLLSLFRGKGGTIT